MTCREAEVYLPGYLDGTVSAERHGTLRAHLNECSSCRMDLERYRHLAHVMARAVPVAAPSDLATRIRVEVSRARNRAGYTLWSRAKIFFENILQPLAVPATGGVLTAGLVFIFLVQSLIVGIPFGNIPNDLPTGLVQPARLESLAPFPVTDVVANGDYKDAGVLIIEATLNAQGQVADYRILSGPTDEAVRHQIDQVLIFSRFQPELNFGRPIAGGRVIVSFSAIRVRG